MSHIGDKVKWQTGDGHWLSGTLLATKGQDRHATAKIKLDGSIGGTVHVQLVKLRPAP